MTTHAEPHGEACDAACLRRGAKIHHASKAKTPMPVSVMENTHGGVSYAKRR